VIQIVSVIAKVLNPAIETRNVINDERPDEYLHVTEFIGIAHPTPDTLAKIAALQPSTSTDGDREKTFS
jgi:hypothetical protein